MKHDLFICHSSQDKIIATTICNELEQEGLSCWIAPRNVRGGQAYAREIVEAIQVCSVVVFVFSAKSNSSSHVENEIDTAFNANKIIIPFRIDSSDMNQFLKYYLNKRHWLDANNIEQGIKELKEGYRECSTACKRGYCRQRHIGQ